MANPVVARGFKVVGSLRMGGSTRTNEYIHDSGDGVALYIGDLVKSDGTAHTLGSKTLPGVVQAAATDIIRGVVMGIKPSEGIAPTDMQLSRLYGPASKSYIVEIDDDPDVILSVISDSTGLAVTDVGAAVDIVVASGSTVTGLSGMTINHSSATTGKQMTILGFVNKPGMTPAAPYSEVLVCPAKHELKAAPTGV